MKSYTIFKLLIKNIAIPVVLILFFLALLNLYHTKEILSESNKLKNEVVTNEIKYLLEFRDIALDLLEKNLDKEIKDKSDLIIHKYLNNVVDYSKVDLYKIRELVGLEAPVNDLYIINSSGVIINTTFENDENLNLFSFGSDHRNYLLGILNGGKFVAERFTIETTSKRLKKYCYQPTTNGKYILEIGTYSKKADDIISLIQNRLTNLSETDLRIKHIDLIMGADYPFSFNKNPWNIKKHSDIIKDIFNNKINREIKVIENKNKYTYTYFYMQRKNTQLYKNSVIQIVTDNKVDQNKIANELVKITLFFILSLAILILLISLQAKKISKSIKHFVSVTNNLLKTNKTLNFENTGITELNNLSVNFSKMSLELNERANQLIEASIREKMKEKEAEVAYKLGLYESVSSYLHHIGNSLTEINHQISSIIKVENSIKQYPEIFIKIREAHKKAIQKKDKQDETLKLLEKFENILTEKLATTLQNATSDIVLIKDQMINSLKEQQAAFYNAKTQSSKLVSEIKINEIIQHVLVDYEQLINKSFLKIKVNFEEGIVVYNQKQQIVQGISAIILNSIEAINESKNINNGIINIVTKKELLSEGPFDYKVHIEIKDNGIGVSETNLNKIFRAGFTTKRMKSGLSLHNFINFLNYNNGKLIFESEGIEKGSKITIVLGNE
ncbi:MAG: HAMP domain-containing histidine kinase [Chlorobi bacterium]|nr:HAMP domain-containing histidine kinase [Chlorobiota bacterium]